MTLVTGFPCPYCEKEICECDDPSPETQEEVTRGSSAKERWDTMIRDLEREGIK